MTAKASTSKAPRRARWIAPTSNWRPTVKSFVDTSRLYQWPKGQPSRFSDPAPSYKCKTCLTIKTQTAKNGKSVGIVDRIKEDLNSLKTISCKSPKNNSKVSESH